MRPYQKNLEELLQNYEQEDPLQGLSAKTATKRLASDGPNALVAKKTPNWLLFIRQFNNMIIYILLFATLLTLFLGHYTDAIVISVVIIANAVIGYYQEANAADALAKIKDLLATNATVYRDGIRQDIDATKLVRDDVVFLEAGDQVPADLRLIKTADLRIQESALTGEADAVTKHASALKTADLPLAEQANMAFSSTTVVNGSGLGVVVATGEKTELGKISSAVASAKTRPTPLVKEINALGKTVSLCVLGAAVLLFILGFIFETYSLPVLTLAIVTMIVGSIPEGLPATTSVILALGVSDLAKNKNAIVKSLPSAETLGAVDVIATDKTGTLTKNEMTVTDIYLDERHFSVSGSGYAPTGALFINGEATTEREAKLKELLLAGYLANDTTLTQVDDTWTINGEPTDGAFLTAYHKLMPNKESVQLEKLDLLPFDSFHRYMASLVQFSNGAKKIYLKGAPDKLFNFAQQQDPTFKRSFWQAKADHLANQGKRVVALGVIKDADQITELEHKHLETGFTFLGLTGIIDPPRPEVIAALREMNKAKVEVKMITGDAPLTAAAIGQQLGLADGELHTITGVEWDQLTAEQKQKAAVKHQIFARTTPENKLEIIEALQQSGKVTAMTGDGVNDAPALKKADIGVSMGIKGTDAAKEASDMILTDDNFATLATAIKEGRRIYDNIKKSILFLLPTSFAEGLIIFLTILFNQEMPLQATQLLWINLVSAITIQFAFIFEPGARDLMKRPPRKSNSRLISGREMLQLGYVSLLIALVGLGAYEMLIATGASATLASTAMVNIIVFSKIFYLFNIRTEESAFSSASFTNKKAFSIILLMILLQMGLTYLPFMQEAFSTTGMQLGEWILTIVCGFSVLAVTELDKYLKLRLARVRN